jgi:hypothetical protein
MCAVVCNVHESDLAQLRYEERFRIRPSRDHTLRRWSEAHASVFRFVSRDMVWIAGGFLRRRRLTSVTLLGLQLLALLIHSLQVLLHL